LIIFRNKIKLNFEINFTKFNFVEKIILLGHPNDLVSESRERER
jgi:hypothetical protein